jgi:hypothetical protein
MFVMGYQGVISSPKFYFGGVDLKSCSLYTDHLKQLSVKNFCELEPGGANPKSYFRDVMRTRLF